MDHNILQNIFFLAKGIKKEHPKLLVLMGIEAVLSVVSPVFSIYIPKIALDLALQGADLLRILAVLGTIGLIMALSMALSGMAREGKYMLYNDMRRYYMMELFLRSLSCDYKYVESAQGQVKYQRAMAMLQDGDWSGTSILVVATMDIFVNTLCFFLYSCILAALSPYVILLLVVLSLVSLASMHHAQEYEHRQQDQAAEYGRKLQYVTDTGSDAAIGKDMRLYHTGGWFAGLRDGLIGQSRELTQKIQDRYFASGIVNVFLFLLRDGFSYTYLIWSVASGRITVPEFALYFGAITAFSGFVDRMVDSLDQLNGANLQMNFLRAYLDDTDGPGPEALIDMVDLDDVSIEFQDVCFSYEQGEPVLEHFDLKVSSGEKVALVGVNGAGKTTIVKLLCGFYQPDSGRILIGGQDISRFKKEDLQKLLAAVFQDIYIPPFSVAENVAMQESGQIDKSRVQKCLIQAGLWEKIAECKKGMDTPVTKEITDGIVLSGGQQQKLLMARALYKDAPILILDEPTAALDPIAESQTYQQFQEIAVDKTTLYISHRLASTRFCDKIAFLSGGKITEEGTHDELIEKGGAYCEMFALQSHYYTKYTREQ